MKKIKRILISIFLILISYILYTEFEFYDIVELDSESGGKCLDGSNYQFFVKEKKDSKNYVFFFDGGGWCSTKYYNSTLESCQKRSETYLGTSNYFVNKIYNFFQTLPLFNSLVFIMSKNQVHNKINKIYDIFMKFPVFKRWMYFLSSDEIHNPDFYNYTKIFLRYCDGRGFIGYNKDPLVYENNLLYFRGLNNTLGTLNYAINKLNLLEADNLVLSGMSAGGLASLLYSNYFRKLLPESIKIRTIFDSGFFLDHPNKINGYNISKIWKNLITDTKPEFADFLDSYCNYKNDELYKCFLPEYFIKNLNVPYFIIYSLYDTYTIFNLIGDKCMFKDGKFCQINEVEQYKEKLITLIEETSSNNEKMGFWIPACFLHDFLYISFDWNNNIQIDNNFLKDAIGKWIRGEKVTLIEKEEKYIKRECKNNRGIYYYFEYQEIMINIF